MVLQTSDASIVNCPPFNLNTSISYNDFIQKYRESPEFQKKVIAALPFIADDSESIKKLKTALFVHFNTDPLLDRETVEKVKKLSRNIRNSGCLNEYREGLIEILPSKVMVHKMILFSESPYFRTVYQSGMKEKNLLSYKCDREGQRLVLTYSKSSDEKRQNFIKNLTVEQATQILFLADYWNMIELVKVCDKILAQRGILDEASWKYLSSINLTPFSYLKSWLFLCRLITAENPEGQPYDINVQTKACAFLDFQQGNPPLIELKPSMFHFLESIKQEDSVPVEFDLKNITMDKQNFNQIYTIATKFYSMNLLSSCLEFESKFWNIATQRPGESEYYVDGYSPDNYCSNHIQEPQLRKTPPERFTKQQSFFIAPCPAADIHLFLTPTTISKDLLNLIVRYRALPIGLSLKTDQVRDLAGLLMKQKCNFLSIRLLNLLDNLDPDKEALQVIFEKLKGLNILVIPEINQKYIQNLPKSVTLWKNLSGKTKLVKGGIHNSFDYLWKKFPFTHQGFEQTPRK